MIVYQNNKENFLDDVMTNDIDQIVLDFFQKKLKQTTSKSEIRSWKESIEAMDRVLRDPSIPGDCGISIEYRIPQTMKRIDFIVTGQNEAGADQLILIELKRWTTAGLTDQDGLVTTRFERGTVATSHPAYQAWSYATLLQGFNETVYTENIALKPCAYLHNYPPDGVILNPFYADYIEKAPVFLKYDARKLQDFIKKHVKYGDRTNILYRIDAGKIKPSKALADSVEKMLKGNPEFVLIDDQKVAYETALALMKRSSAEKKSVLIIEGGPGTGKSVVAINLLAATLKLGLLTHYVSKNAAPRSVYESKLTGKLRATEIRNLFKGSGSYIETEPNAFDGLIVDEAHRLNEKSGLYANLGENQIKELIRSAKSSIFFIDEDQRVTLNDIGEKKEIRRWAEQLGAEVTALQLDSQFRCNGSDGYLAWLDQTLQIRETANQQLDIDYDFRILDSPTALRDLIFEKNQINNKARLVAGYCWNWASKKDSQAYDIEFPAYDFRMRWNLTTDGSLWIISPNSVNEIGCIHTCQGLEVDYVGVIIGPDLIVRNGQVITDPAKRARSDRSTNTYKSYLKKHPQTGPAFLDRIIKNTYRALMTRGMKGCYVYFTDEETRAYFKNHLNGL